ncbi:MAG: PAS domain S-box protein [Cyclobacteriaceae bacterium]|nr:PAS domain S-box protein [Cyclobacteriaceae bacterium]
MIDLKETKRIKDALQQEPQKFQKIIEDTFLAICITSKEANFVAVNSNYEKLYGYRREDLIGNSFTIVVPMENRKDLKLYHDRFFVDKYEILRKWQVQGSDGRIIDIFADAGYNDKINGAPHKITLVQAL